MALSELDGRGLSSLISGRIEAGANVLHTSVEPELMLGCSDETVALVKSSRFFVDSIDHGKTCRSGLPGSDCLAQCLGEKHCTNASSLL